MGLNQFTYELNIYNSTEGENAEYVIQRHSIIYFKHKNII